MIMYQFTVVIRGDDEQKLEELNPIPRERELVGVRMNDGSMKYKFGDGKTPYMELPFIDNISNIDYLYIYHGCHQDASPSGRIFLNRFVFDEMYRNDE